MGNPHSHRPTPTSPSTPSHIPDPLPHPHRSPPMSPPTPSHTLTRTHACSLLVFKTMQNFLLSLSTLLGCKLQLKRIVDLVDKFKLIHTSYTLLCDITLDIRSFYVPWAMYSVQAKPLGIFLGKFYHWLKATMITSNLSFKILAGRLLTNVNVWSTTAPPAQTKDYYWTKH